MYLDGHKLVYQPCYIHVPTDSILQTNNCTVYFLEFKKNAACYKYNTVMTNSLAQPNAYESGDFFFMNIFVC